MYIPGYDSLTEVERALIDWQYHLCGHFRKALWEVIILADGGNLERLRLGFPVEVEGYLRYTREEGFWKSVIKKAGGDVEVGY